MYLYLNKNRIGFNDYEQLDKISIIPYLEEQSFYAGEDPKIDEDFQQRFNPLLDELYSRLFMIEPYTKKLERKQKNSEKLHL